MSYSFDGANDVMSGSFTGSYDVPITIACWFKFDTHPAVVDNLVSLGASESVVANSLNLRTVAAPAVDQFRAIQVGTDGLFDQATVTKSGINATWTPFIGRFTNDDDRDGFVGDATSNNTGSSIGVSALKYLRVGETLTDGLDFTGQIAEIAIWDIALSDSEIADYQAGVPASEIAPANLIGYWPLDTESGTQSNEGVNATGDLSVVGATFSAEHPGISSGSDFTLAVDKADIGMSPKTFPLGKGMPVTAADLQSAGKAVTWALAASFTAAIPVIDPQIISLGFLVEGEVAVETATPTLSPSNITLALKSPVTKADITLAPQAINLIPAGVLRVDSGTPAIAGSAVTLEVGRFFDQAAFAPAGKDVGLRRGTPVISAAPTIAGSEITLTVPITLTMAVEPASLSPAGQDVGFQITWVVPVTSASFDIDGVNVDFQFVIDDGLAVEPAQLPLDGQDIIGGIGIRVAEALPTIAPQDITFLYDQRLEVGFDEEGVEDITRIGFVGQEITLESTFTLGVLVDGGAFSIVGQDITRHIGSGAPTTIKGYYSSWAAHGSFSAPIAVGDATSEQIAKVG